MKYRYTEKEIKELISHLVILHATNEQKNEHILDYFDKHKVKHKAKALKTGDYTFMIEACPELGFIKDTYFTDEICIERKNSVDELAGNIKEQNERFFKEVNRMINIEHCYLLIEDSKVDDIIEHNYRSQYNELAYLRRFLNMQRVANIKTHFVKKSNMGKLIYELCYNVFINSIHK